MNALKYLLNINDKQSLDEKNKDTISRLKFIGTFLPGEKVDVKNMRIEGTTLCTPLKRLFMGESRDTTYIFLNNTIERTYEIISSHCTSPNISDKLLCQNIINDLVRSVAGLKNIQKTYKEDKLFQCNVETMIEKIQAKLTEVKTKYPDIFTIENEFSEKTPLRLTDESVLYDNREASGDLSNLYQSQGIRRSVSSDFEKKIN